MSASSPTGFRRALRILRWTWIIAIGVVVAWHISLLTVDNAEVVRPVILAYIVVCFPIGIGVMLILALWGSLSDAPSTFGRYDDVVVACLFVVAGWFQWYRMGSWLLSAWERRIERKRIADPTME